MTQTLTRAREIPQTPPAAARATLTAEYAALLTLVEGMGPEDWARPTDCAGWTVRHMVAHLAGAAECNARRLALVRHYAPAIWRSRRDPSTMVDHMSASQIASRDGLTDRELTADLRRWAAAAPAKLEATPGPLRRVVLPAAAQCPPGARLSYFVDVISARDVWLHRVDLARALGTEREVTTAEDEVVSQAVRDLDIEWDSRWHGPALDLTLTGPDGGGGQLRERTWRLGGGEPVAHVTENAVALMRLLSGRSDECVLATEGDPAATQALRSARVLF